MTDFQLLAKGIALAGCAIGAGAALIAGIGPGIGEGNAVAKDRRDHWYLRFRYRSAADLRSTWYLHELPVLSLTKHLLFQSLHIICEDF